MKDNLNRIDIYEKCLEKKGPGCMKLKSERVVAMMEAVRGYVWIY